MFINSYLDDNGVYIIEDTDFIEKVKNDMRVSGWEIIVQAYEKRNLDVVKNLILAMQQYDIISCFMSMDIFEDKEYYSKYLKYKNEIEKYLILA